VACAIKAEVRATSANAFCFAASPISASSLLERLSRADRAGRLTNHATNMIIGVSDAAMSFLEGGYF